MHACIVCMPVLRACTLFMRPRDVINEDQDAAKSKEALKNKEEVIHRYSICE